MCVFISRKNLTLGHTLCLSALSVIPNIMNEAVQRENLQVAIWVR